MPTFTTPDPIQAVIEFTAGDARITATERDETTAEVRPSDPNEDSQDRPESPCKVRIRCWSTHDRIAGDSSTDACRCIPTLAPRSNPQVGSP